MDLVNQVVLTVKNDNNNKVHFLYSVSSCFSRFNRASEFNLMRRLWGFCPRPSKRYDVQLSCGSSDKFNPVLAQVSQPVRLSS